MPAAEDAFGVDSPATVGNLMAALYCGLGGPANAPEDARAWLAGYGLVSEDQDLDAELNEQFLCDLMSAIGVGLTTDTPDAVVPRSDLADLLFQVFNQ